jgi:L-malate glycosyltransferase
MKKILHISYDLRDRHNREVTTAVSNLINVGSSKLDPSIIDLVRVPNPLDEEVQLKNPKHLMINVLGFPYGILMNWSQNRAVKFIERAESDNSFSLKDINLIHTHKLTFEGLVGYKLANKLDIPLVTTLRQTDTMVFNRKPGAVETFKPVIKSCHRFFYLIPQILVRMKRIFGEEFYEEHIEPKVVFLPNIVERNINIKGETIGKGMLLTVLRMTKKSVQRKNLKRLLQALKSINDDNVKLKIIGDGEYKPQIQTWIKELGLFDRVIFVGAVPNEEIDKYFRSTEAFLLPSISETFGMVYAESLLNGSPIMYSENYLGFDGFFEGVGVGVDPKSVESIKNGIIDLLKNGSRYRDNIKSLQQAGEFKVFNKEYIKDKYLSTMEQV